MTVAVGWGIIGTGLVANDFAAALSITPGASIVGVVSGKTENARAFAAKWRAAAIFEDVDALVADPRIDIVYVASRTRLHRAHCLAAIAAGKAVLCEKPFTRSAEEATDVVAAARAAGVFCMEAMWLRFNPVIRELKAQIAAETIGPLASAALSIGYAKPGDEPPSGRDEDGATRVFGCYGLSLALHLFGAPASCRAVTSVDAAGVDTNAAFALGYSHHVMLIDASIVATRANRLEVTGRDGVAIIPHDVIDPRIVLVRRRGGGRVREAVGMLLQPLRGRSPISRRNAQSGFRGEINEAMNGLRSGVTESAIMPLDDTIAVQRMMAAIDAPGP